MIGYGIKQNEVFMIYEYEDVISKQKSIDMYQTLTQQLKMDITWALHQRKQLLIIGDLMTQTQLNIVSRQNLMNTIQ